MTFKYIQSKSQETRRIITHKKLSFPSNLSNYCLSRSPLLLNSVGHLTNPFFNSSKSVLLLLLFTLCNVVGLFRCPVPSALRLTPHVLWACAAPEAYKHKTKEIFIIARFALKRINFWGNDGFIRPCNFGTSFGLLCNLR